MGTAAGQEEFDNSLRLYTYRQVIASGKAPVVAQAAVEIGVSEVAVRAGYARLSESHAFMLTESGELWRVAPFSAIPTAFPVESGGRTYYANCIWDALGIPAVLGQDATIPASCACCNLEMRLRVQGGTLLPHEGLIHVAVPARRWYEDVVFTWKTILLFRSEQHVDRWCRQWNRERGGTFSLKQGWDLAGLWYGDRLSPKWRPFNAREAQQVFAKVGLSGEFWSLG
jgi:hypothetical protein